MKEIHLEHEIKKVEERIHEINDEISDLEKRMNRLSLYRDDLLADFSKDCKKGEQENER